MTTVFRLLGVFAHPDDESFGPGGTMAKYAREGVEVHICIATDGAAGSVEPALLEGYANLAERRTEELTAAVAVLGGVLHRLPYGDSGMAGSDGNQNPDCLVQAPLDEVGKHLVRLIREIQPQVVVAHDPTGGYWHPDHIKVNQATLRAWELCGDPTAFPELNLPPYQPARLYWSVIPKGFLKWLVPMLRLLRRDPTKFGTNHDIDITKIGVDDDLIHTRIDVQNYLDIKNAASRHHVSQGGGTGGPWAWMPTFLQRRFFGTELFSQVYPPTPIYGKDFFEGLR
jgi:LmbE family N-acetylglucosaminyl deacetylase